MVSILQIFKRKSSEIRKKVNQIIHASKHVGLKLWEMYKKPFFLETPKNKTLILSSNKSLLN